jgi:perosamine synthetase
MEWKIPLFRMYHDDNDIKAVSDVIKRNTYWATGPEIAEFEKKIADYAGRKYAVALNSGTSALHLLLSIYDVKDKEVIVPSFTFIATANSVILAGGKPVFAEVENETFALDAEDVKNKITDKTKVIMPIHYGGFPARDIEKLRKIADEKGIILIEDAAQSLGASIKGKMIGSFGDSAIFSFCQNKIISTGEGGMIVTDSNDVYEKAKLLSSHGRVEEEKDYFSTTKDNDYIEGGYNFRMPSMCAALGISQFEKIDKIIDIRRNIAERFDKEFSKIKEIEILKRMNEHFQVYQMYTIKLPDGKIRDNLQEHLSKNKIMSKIYFNPIHLKTIYKKEYKYKEGSLPKTEALSKRILTLPIYTSMKKEEIDYLIKKMKEFFENE